MVPLRACAVTVVPACLKMYCRDSVTCPDSPGPRCADTLHRSTASSKAKQLAAFVLSPSSTPLKCLPYRPYFWNSQSLLSRGQTWRALSHLEMQWKWKACCKIVSREPLCRSAK